MKSFTKGFCVLFFGLLSLAACSNSGSKQVAATINGKPVYIQELDQAFGGRIAQQIYEIRKGVLDDLVDQRLLDQAAQEKNMSADDLLKEEVDGKIDEPTEEEIRAIYEANKDQLDSPFEAIKPQIINSLKRNRQNIQKNVFLSQLKQKAKIDVRMEKPAVERVQVSADDDPFLGPKSAKVTVIEFSDYQCPFCGRARATVAKLTSTYKNDVKYVFRDFPLSFHKDSFSAHVAAQCANEQGKYWEYNKLLFENQASLKIEDLKKDAENLGLNTKEFDLCLDSNKYASEVQKDMDDGVKAGVSGTPSFFINGIMISGAQPFEKFKEIIDEELKKK